MAIATRTGTAIADIATVNATALAGIETIDGIEVGGGGEVLFATNVNAIDGHFNVSQFVADDLIGPLGYDPGANINVSSVEIPMSLNNGSIVGKTFTCEIWTYGGTNLTTKIGTSDGVAGSDAWADTPVNYPFAVPVALSNGTQYGIVFRSNTVDGVNRASIATAGSSGFPGLTGFFSAAGVRDTFDTARAKLSIYIPA